MSTQLPNGIEIFDDNSIVGTSDNDFFRIDEYDRFLDGEINIINVDLKEGDDELDAGNLFNDFYNGVSRFRQLPSVNMNGGDGDDNFVARGGGFSKISGGNGFDGVLTDVGDFITLDYDFTTSDNEITFVPKQPKDKREENTKIVISKDVEMLRDFGNNYLLVEDLFNGEINYLNAEEASQYREDYKNGVVEDEEPMPDTPPSNDSDPVTEPDPVDPSIDADLDPKPLDPEVSGLYIEGTGTKDKITGTQFDDDIYGFGGNDRIRAGNGDDLIDAGDGRKNVVRSGKGFDIIVLNDDARVIIKDFDAELDALSLDGVSGQTSYQQRGNNFYIYDNDGDMIARLKGEFNIDQIDFV